MIENELMITPIRNEKLLNAARLLPNDGILKLSPALLLYLDIDDRYIDKLYSLVDEEYVEKPDYFSMGIGAHISVIYPNELQNPIYEPGQKMQFQVESLFRAENEQAIYYALAVQSPDILQIRHVNQLGKKLNLNGSIVDMHITIGKIYK